MMKIRTAFLPLLSGLLLLIAGCGDYQVRRDAEKIGDAMCRNIEVMSKLRIVDARDTVALHKLQVRADEVQGEMAELYKAFNKKYGDKVKSAEFSKKFSRELRKAMLDCPYLSKVDKEQFEKDLKE